jgi:phospholipid/cholesterol/gamma-HCH transport system substrate-binding protein
METRSNHILVGSVTLALILAIVIAAFWFSRIGEGDNREYDIFFKQSVNGLAKGSGVSYAGVPSGQVKSIELWRKDPDFVRVRIAVNDRTPILQGTTATRRRSAVRRKTRDPPARKGCRSFRPSRARWASF